MRRITLPQQPDGLAQITYLLPDKPCDDLAPDSLAPDLISREFCAACGYHYTDHKNLTEQHYKQLETEQGNN